MKASRLLWGILVLSNLLAFTQSTFALGQLSPTAAPAPTMKTLSQIETLYYVEIHSRAARLMLAGR